MKCHEHTASVFPRNLENLLYDNLGQGYLAERLKSSFMKFYGRYGDLIQQYELSLSRMLDDILILDQQ